MQLRILRLVSTRSFATAIIAWSIFLALAVAVAQGSTQGFDGWVLRALRDPLNPAQPLGPPWLQETARDLTAVGSNSVLGGLTLATAGFLARVNRPREAKLLLAAFFGALILEGAVKHWYGRPRPDLVPPVTRVFTTSFPSSHATLSAVVYLTLALLLARTFADHQVRHYAMMVTTGLIAAIGISRMYLGVHWPTDVLAGWALGTGWVGLCWGVMTCWIKCRQTS